MDRNIAIFSLSNVLFSHRHKGASRGLSVASIHFAAIGKHTLEFIVLHNFGEETIAPAEGGKEDSPLWLHSGTIFTDGA
jgi:hypothetical protein